MKRKVVEYISKHRLLVKEGLHLVALSGGADSVALLLLLRDLGYCVEAAHCNFHLRGEESDRDETFVKDLCDKEQIPLHLIHFDTMEYASLHQVSIEMAARELRYRYFHQLYQDIGATSVCVAHHRDDAVETFLMNLLRGSGIHGLTGIRPKNGNIVRPLLCLSRQEIEAYLRQRGQDYVTDSTNLTDDVMRNKLRLNVLPLLSEINPSVAENIDKTASFLREAEKVIDHEIATARQRMIRTDQRYQTQLVQISDLLQLPSPEIFLHEWLMPLGFNSTQIVQISNRLIGDSGREFHSSTHVLVLDRETIALEPIKQQLEAFKLPEPGLYQLQSNNLHVNTDEEKLYFDVRLFNDVTVSKSADCATLDASAIRFPLTIRPVQQGDAFIPFGMTGRKLVNDFLTDRKYSLLEKRRQLVVTDATGNIIWLVGLRTDNRYRITTGTTIILSIKRSYR